MRKAEGDGGANEPQMRQMTQSSIAGIRLVVWMVGILFCTLGVAPALAKEPARQSRLPSVGTIQDYPATGLTTGCANLYFILPSDREKIGAAYVWIAREDGDDAWMNLNGRDRRLIRLGAKSFRRPDGSVERWVARYRAGITRITVEIRTVETSDDYTMTAEITLRAGKQKRVVRAIGYSDC